MSRLLRALRSPLRLWQGSLPLRVIATTLAASIVVLGLGGWLLTEQVTNGVLETKQRTALAEASIAYESAQRQLTAANQTGTNVNEILTQLAFEVANRGSVTDQYQVVVQGPVSDIRSGNIEAESVPESLRRTVAEEDNLWITPTLVRYTDGSTEPGYAVGGALLAPGAGRYQIYFIFPLTDEVRTLEVLQTASLTTGTMMVIALALVAAMVARQVVVPVRRARLAAERLASGELDARMTVRGTDDLASLGTSMNHMATELQGQITQLEDLSRVQQRFVSDVSHELRTPLTTVRMAADMLYDSRDEFSTVAARSAELLHEEVERFQGLLDDLLEISRFDAGAAVLSTDAVDLAELTRQEIDAHSGLAERYGTPISLHVDGPVRAEADPRRVRRILRNLISNAIEHGEQQPIEVYVAGDDRGVAIAVRDHGVGFPANQGSQVFHRFWRGDTARARTIGGSGLGLAISMEDARLHGGWLNAWGRPNQGAQFRLTLPRVQGTVVEVSPLPVMPRDYRPTPTGEDA